ncbi:hypothetical protein K0M31_005905 [Melipona bicolor]|uniref:Uncharacterized protein n=1 Tax=Melipona bicolor TaxID=60889 RepID=A0AA40FUB5_9HYME|nr:hypothetical protein K0M31_005905 [Melipona bicolor]
MESVSFRSHCLNSSSVGSADSSDSLPQTLVVVTIRAKAGGSVTHHSGIPHTACLTSKIGSTSMLGAQPLAASQCLELIGHYLQCVMSNSDPLLIVRDKW